MTPPTTPAPLVPTGGPAAGGPLAVPATPAPRRLSRLRTAARWLLGAALVYAGVAHLTRAREEFRAQVPPWAVERPPFDADDIVLMSGVAEIALGAGLVLMKRDQRRMGTLAALFFTAVLPGNIAQLTEHRDAFGLDTDRKRAIRLAFQPLLVAWALWSTRQRPA